MSKATKKELEIARRAFKSMKIVKVTETKSGIYIEANTTDKFPIVIIVNHE